MQTSPHFLTHNDTIARFTSQSLGLPTYACIKDRQLNCNKISSQNAQKLATFSLKNEKQFLGMGHSPFDPRTSPRWGGDPTSSAPWAPRSSRSPWFVPHFLNRGYAPDSEGFAHHVQWLSNDDNADFWRRPYIQLSLSWRRWTPRRAASRVSCWTQIKVDAQCDKLATDDCR